MSGREWEASCEQHDDMVEALLVKVSVLGPPSALMVRRSVLLEAGPFDQRLSHSEDWDMWLRIAKHYQFAKVPEVLVYLLQHAEQAQRNADRMADGLLVLAEKITALTPPQ